MMKIKAVNVWIMIDALKDSREQEEVAIYKKLEGLSKGKPADEEIEIDDDTLMSAAALLARGFIDCIDHCLYINDEGKLTQSQSISAGLESYTSMLNEIAQYLEANAD